MTEYFHELEREITRLEVQKKQILQELKQQELEQVSNMLKKLKDLEINDLNYTVDLSLR